MKITNFKKLIGASAFGLAVLVGGSASAQAQETQTQPQDGQKSEKRFKHHGRGGEGFRHGGKMRGFSQLNLTDAQKTQMQQIAERFRLTTQPLREQLRATRESADTTQREQLHTQLKTAHKQMNDEMLAVLTTEQKTQLEQFKEQHKQMREQRRQQFEQRRKERQTQTPTIN